MAQQNRTVLKGYFETGDKPTEAQFIDLIDSAVNITDDGGALSVGTVGQVPYMNSGGTDFDYSALFRFDGTDLNISGSYNTLVTNETLRSTTIGVEAENNNFKEIYTGGVIDIQRYYAGGFYPTLYIDNADTGSSNLFIGDWAAEAKTTPSSCIAVGTYAMSGLISGTDNCAIGNSSLNTITTTNENTALGNQAGQLTTGSGSVFLGFHAGSKETGSNKLYIDNQNRTNEATGRTNSLIYGEFNAIPGSQLLRINGDLELPHIGIKTTETNVLHYDPATDKVTYGTTSSGVSFGTNGQIPRTNSGGTDFDYDATLVYKGKVLQLNSGNTSMIMTTATSLYASLSGVNNLIIGTNNMVSASTAANNTVVGITAGVGMTTGAYNALYGVSAGDGITTGDKNICIGSFSGDAITTQNNNTCVGDSAARLVAGANNTVIGFEALRNNTAAGNSVAIGYEAGQDSGTATGLVLIGYQAGLNETTSNKLHIANNSTQSIIEGDFSGKTLSLNAAVNYYTGALTDGAPTNAEINTIITAPTGAGYEAIIKDTTGSSKMYKVIYDGTGWHYEEFTTAT